MTITVTSSNPDVLLASVITGSQSLRMSVQDRGELVFQLFNQMTPNTSARLIQLTQAGFYDTTVDQTLTFHRVFSNFVIQSGDPSGTGSGGSNLGPLDDEYNLDQQYTGNGLLGFAKGQNDTGNSQFFITEGAQRSLDFKHSVIGQLVEGEEVREGISREPTTGNNRPTNNVIVSKTEVFTDSENGVIKLKAAGNQVGSSVVTVTVTNAVGFTSTQTFNVTVSPDTVNTPPFLTPVVAPATIVQNNPITIQLNSLDAENDAVEYFVRSLDNVPYTSSIDQANRTVTITPPNGYLGPINVLVGVRQPNGLTFAIPAPEDTQAVKIMVLPPAPSSLDLLASSDTGASNSDNITKASPMEFTVAGVTSGATVRLKAGRPFSMKRWWRPEKLRSQSRPRKLLIWVTANI